MPEIQKQPLTGHGLGSFEYLSPTFFPQIGKQTAPDGVDIYNPAFDVTPAELVTAIITENGIVTPPYFEGLRRVTK